MTTPLKARMQRGEPVFGTFVFLPSPPIVEILGQSGLDFVVIDLEHSPKNWETVENMVRAAELSQMSVLVRLRDSHEKSVLEALELGAEGVVVPFVRTPEDARAAAMAAKYAPEGARGTCTLTRAARYGSLRGGFIEHARRTNERTLVIGQLEDPGAVEHAEAIAAMENGIDVLLVGRADLASSLGRPGQVNDPAVLDATERIIGAAARCGVPGRQSGIGVYSAAEAEAWMKKGVRFFLYGADTSLILNAAKTAAESFRALAESQRQAA